MNRQARLDSGVTWFNCGNVTHVEAARQLVEIIDRERFTPSTVEVETRDEGSDVIHRHTVTREVVYKVVPHREECDE